MRRNKVFYTRKQTTRYWIKLENPRHESKKCLLWQGHASSTSSGITIVGSMHINVWANHSLCTIVTYPWWSQDAVSFTLCRHHKGSIIDQGYHVSPISHFLYNILHVWYDVNLITHHISFSALFWIINVSAGACTWIRSIPSCYRRLFTCM